MRFIAMANSTSQAVILEPSSKPERLSPQNRVITGNSWLGASYFDTKASTTFNTFSGISSSLETMTIGICGLRRFISIATSCPFISGIC